MKKNYLELLSNIRNRSNPSGLNYKKRLLDEALNIPDSDVNEYVKVAMFGVPQEYTDISKEAAKKVIKTLEKIHDSEVEFRYQGSIETNTHIWAENDIDIVQITSKSSTKDMKELKKALSETHKYTPEESKNLKKHYDNFSEYQGDQLVDLKEIRLKSEKGLVEAYTDVDIKKPKAICVKMKNPKRNIDVVTATYYKAIDYMKSNEEYKKGIQIYDKDYDRKLPQEYPFWSIKLINEKNIYVQGRLKKMIRFLKNVKFDTGVQNGKKLIISSFDINAICFKIDPKLYMYKHYLDLVSVVSQELNKLVNDNLYRNNLKSIDGQEDIFFGKGHDKLNDLIELRDSVDLILFEIRSQNKIAI